MKFTDLYAGANGRVYVAAGGGCVYRYDDSYNDWTPIGAADRNTLTAIDIFERENGEPQKVALTRNGDIFQRDGRDRWEELPSPTRNGLRALALGSPDVAVGKGGTVIQRSRPDSDGSFLPQ